MGEGQLALLRVVVRHEQPAREALLEFAAAVRQGRVRGLGHEAVDVVAVCGG